ncbi:MAG TPA: tRNA preQ1(34) S-adenosylmethionine ribosyltransferase-isomerase QueA [Myxococcota bacterium]|nr:tRNA preQ1(34) S-adenosylmethionine ribosyltransferase-isomerase QueA [Myxococcota bacterium]
MRLSEFDYDLPPEQIAQLPAESRDGSRLMLISPGKESPEHRRFPDIAKMLKPRDLLVLNDTRVIPARLHGLKETGGAVELLLDRPLDCGHLEAGSWVQRFSCLVRASRPLRCGISVSLPGGGQATGEGQAEGGQASVRLVLPQPANEYLDRYGEVPLPAYIKRTGWDDPRRPLDMTRYQTIYARQPGAIAAPTAGLHFSRELLDRIRESGVEIAFLTLHVGPGTFLPVRVEEIERHKMHPERFRIDTQTAQAIARARDRKSRVVAVGTTVVRALEAAFDGRNVVAGEGETELFIRPGFEFGVVDALLTNFHLPRSTLLMLVCAFAGREKILAAYGEALRQGYRFYSYGDAMFIDGRGGL